MEQNSFVELVTEISAALKIDPDHVRQTRLWAVIRLVVADEAHRQLSDASGALGIAITNLRRDAAYWREKIERMDNEADDRR